MASLPRDFFLQLRRLSNDSSSPVGILENATRSPDQRQDSRRSANLRKCNFVAEGDILCTNNPKPQVSITYLPVCDLHSAEKYVRGRCQYKLARRDGSFRTCNTIIRICPPYFPLCDKHRDEPPGEWSNRKHQLTGIPTEIRLMILAYLLPDKPIGAITGKTGLREDGERCHLSMIYTNRLIKEECYDIVYDKLPFVMIIDGSVDYKICCYWRGAPTLRLGSKERYKRRVLDRAFHLIKNLELQIVFSVRERGRQDLRDPATNEEWADMLDQVYALTRNMAACPGFVLRKLVVSFVGFTNQIHGEFEAPPLFKCPRLLKVMAPLKAKTSAETNWYLVMGMQADLKPSMHIANWLFPASREDWELTGSIRLNALNKLYDARLARQGHAFLSERLGARLYSFLCRPLTADKVLQVVDMRYEDEVSAIADAMESEMMNGKPWKDIATAAEEADALFQDYVKYLSTSMLSMNMQTLELTLLAAALRSDILHKSRMARENNDLEGINKVTEELDALARPWHRAHMKRALDVGAYMDEWVQVIKKAKTSGP